MGVSTPVLFSKNRWHVVRLGAAMTYLNVLPAMLSLMLLAAHFLRAGSLAVVVLVLLVAWLLLVRRPWANLLAQWVLVVGALEWVRTLVVLADERQLAGVPYTRMVLILGVVGAFTLASAALVGPRRIGLRAGPGNAPAESR